MPDPKPFNPLNPESSAFYKMDPQRGKRTERLGVVRLQRKRAIERRNRAVALAGGRQGASERVVRGAIASITSTWPRLRPIPTS